MHLLNTLPILFASQVWAATVFLCGDSTMAHWAASSDKQGWGDFFADFTTLGISNHAVSGRSARSYTREGHFDAVAAKIRSGDFAVIELGHNDGGSLTPTDDGRAPCNDPSGVCQTTFNGKKETVYTFDTYLANAAKLFKSKGATVIISSQTPNNVWESGSYSYTPSRFVTGAQKAASTAGVAFVDHGLYVAQLYKQAGAATVKTYYPTDHTHTTLAGAKVVARAFALAVKDSSSTLKNSLKGV